MKLELSTQQKNAKAEFRAFVNQEICPDAGEWDRKEFTPPELIKKIAQRGFLGAILPQEYGGQGIRANASYFLIKTKGDSKMT